MIGSSLSSLSSLLDVLRKLPLRSAGPGGGKMKTFTFHCTCGDDNELEDDSDDVDEPTDEGVSRVLHSVPSLPTLVLGPTTPARVGMEMTGMGLTMTMIMD